MNIFLRGKLINCFIFLRYGILYIYIYMSFFNISQNWLNLFMLKILLIRGYYKIKIATITYKSLIKLGVLRVVHLSEIQ